MSQVNTKLLNKEQTLGSTSDSVSDMSQVNTDNAKYECISDHEICTLLDGKSVYELVDHFRPAIQTMLREVHMCPDWDSSNLADTLGIKKQDMTDILEGKSTKN